MSRTNRLITAALILAFFVGSSSLAGGKVAAQTSPRQMTITVSYTEYQWWLIRWLDNQIMCTILADHEGLPTPEEVHKYCGETIYKEWISTPPCEQVAAGSGSTSECQGFYLFMVSFQPKERQVVVELPPSVAYVSLEGCDPKPPANLCSSIPLLVITGEEPLPNERIIAVHGTYDGVPFTCEGDTCKLQLRPTPLTGSTVEFWVESSFGDISEVYTAQIRVVDTGVSQAPGEGGWYIDVISSQWRGVELASCMREWQAFPPLGGPPVWLTTPDRTELMASDEPYFYLAGRLIFQGVVDASSCSTGGLLPNGYADACGLDRARPLVEEWQNQFDTRIIAASTETGVPAQLMKNLFAQESQFWPGVFRVPYEFGLGQITDKGADTILLWNESFYNQFCPLVLAEDACAAGYLRLDDENRAILRGALALQVKADCSECPTGIDLSNTDFSVSLFAKTLQANCAQVNQVIATNTGQIAGKVSTYEDLWRFTIANYHAGPGCLSYAVYSAWQESGGGSLTWEGVANQFTDPCKGVVPYVEKITR